MNLLQRMRKIGLNKKGFTLVELIVVLVILAILLAILVPSLVGWINRARTRGDLVEARQVYLAAQTIAEENDTAGPLGLGHDDPSNPGTLLVDAIIQLATNTATSVSPETNLSNSLNGSITGIRIANGAVTAFEWTGARSIVSLDPVNNTLTQKPLP